MASLPAVHLPLDPRQDLQGALPPRSMLIFSPFLMFTRMHVMFKRAKRKGEEPAFYVIADGVYLGGWPTSPERTLPVIPSVVDCTCELPRNNVVVRFW